MAASDPEHIDLLARDQCRSNDTHAYTTKTRPDYVFVQQNPRIDCRARANAARAAYARDGATQEAQPLPPFNAWWWACGVLSAIPLAALGWGAYVLWQWMTGGGA